VQHNNYKRRLFVDFLVAQGELLHAAGVPDCRPCAQDDDLEVLGAWGAAKRKT